MATQQELDELYKTFPDSRPSGLTGLAQNVFGTVPSYYEGLLGPAETQALQKKSTNQGLLGAAISLLGGMGTRGTTAQQNIAGALSGGIQASQGAIQQGLTNYQMQQQLAQAKVAQEQAASLRADVAKVMQMPEVANNPALIASLRADPAKTLAWINENMAVSQAYQPQAPQQPGAETAMVEPPPQLDGKSLPAVSVTAKVSPLQTQKDRLLSANTRLTVIPGDAASKALKNNLDQIATLDKQLMQESVSTFDFNGIKNAVSPDLLPQVNNLQRLAETGQITAKDLQDGLKDIQKADFDFKKSQTDYTKDAVRIAATMFPGVAFGALNAEQLGKLTNEIDRREIVKRKAGATNLSVYGDKVLAGERAKSQAAAEESAMATGTMAADVRAIVDILKPYRGGGLQDFAANIGNYLPGTSLEQLATAQNVASSIRSRIAPTLRVPGSGATSDFEAKQFLNAIPSLMQTQEGRELMAVYSQKFADRAAAAADIRGEMTESGTYSMRGFQQRLKDAGFAQILTPDDILILQGKKGASKLSPGTSNLLDKYAPKR
jgi:hypothetical protein